MRSYPIRPSVDCWLELRATLNRGGRMTPIQIGLTFHRRRSVWDTDTIVATLIAARGAGFLLHDGDGYTVTEAGRAVSYRRARALLPAAYAQHLAEDAVETAT